MGKTTRQFKEPESLEAAVRAAERLSDMESVKRMTWVTKDSRGTLAEK